MARILLVHWNPEEAGRHVAALRKAGHDVRLLCPEGIPALRALAADLPEAIVIDLGRLPSQGRAVATTLRQQRATREVPLVFVEGDPEKTARVRALLPDAAYTTWPGLAGMLQKAMKTWPRAKPVVPGTMAAYSGTPLPRKLGIKPGSAVALLGAPSDFARKMLGPLPQGATIRQDTRAAYNVGLVDYKIAAIDATWSGLCFARRKAKG